MARSLASLASLASPRSHHWWNNDDRESQIRERSAWRDALSEKERSSEKLIWGGLVDLDVNRGLTKVEVSRSLPLLAGLFLHLLGFGCSW